jgi:hypothetical protein
MRWIGRILLVKSVIETVGEPDRVVEQGGYDTVNTSMLVLLNKDTSKSPKQFGGVYPKQG